MNAPSKITDQVVEFLTTAPNAVRQHGMASLRVEGERFVMRGPSGTHSLLIQATDAARLDAHWQQFATHSLNLQAPRLARVPQEFDTSALPLFGDSSKQASLF